MKIYSYNTGGVILTDYIVAPETETSILWWRNDDLNNLVLSLHQIVINVRPKGLSNRSDIALTAKLRVAATVPTNGIPLPAINVDTSSTFPLPVTAYYNPTGLNSSFQGVLGGTLSCKEGNNQFDFKGNSAISNFPGNSLVLTIESKDYCEFAIEQLFVFRQAAS